MLANESQREAYERCLDEVSPRRRRYRDTRTTSDVNVFLSLQVANHVVQALLNQKVQLPPARRLWPGLAQSGLVRSDPVLPSLA